MALLNSLPEFIDKPEKYFEWHGHKFDVRNANIIVGSGLRMQYLDFLRHDKYLIVNTLNSILYLLNDKLELKKINTDVDYIDIAGDVLVIKSDKFVYLYDLIKSAYIHTIHLDANERIHVVDNQNYIRLYGNPAHAMWCGDIDACIYGVRHVNFDRKNRNVYLSSKDDTKVYDYEFKFLRELSFVVRHIYDEYLFSGNNVYTIYGLHLGDTCTYFPICGHKQIDHKIPERLYDCLPDMPSPLVRIIASYV